MHRKGTSCEHSMSWKLLDRVLTPPSSSCLTPAHSHSSCLRVHLALQFLKCSRLAIASVCSSPPRPFSFLMSACVGTHLEAAFPSRCRLGRWPFLRSLAFCDCLPSSFCPFKPTEHTPAGMQARGRCDKGNYQSRVTDGGEWVSSGCSAALVVNCGSGSFTGL